VRRQAGSRQAQAGCWAQEERDRRQEEARQEACHSAARPPPAQPARCSSSQEKVRGDLRVFMLGGR